MGEQLGLNLVPISRRTDPATSRAAERAINRSGQRADQARAVLDAIRANPDRTCREIANIASLGADAVSKRLSDLEQVGRIVAAGTRTCAYSGRLARTWRVVRERDVRSPWGEEYEEVVTARDRKFARELARLQMAALRWLAEGDREWFLERAAARLRVQIYGEGEPSR